MDLSSFGVAQISLKRIKVHKLVANKIFFGSIKEIEKARNELGYRGCKWCLPDLLKKEKLDIRRKQKET
jgi:hypothetical protein